MLLSDVMICACYVLGYAGSCSYVAARPLGTLCFGTHCCVEYEPLHVCVLFGGYRSGPSVFVVVCIMDDVLHGGFSGPSVIDCGVGMARSLECLMLHCLLMIRDHSVWFSRRSCCWITLALSLYRGWAGRLMVYILWVPVGGRCMLAIACSAYMLHCTISCWPLPHVALTRAY
jgi:hypothetical protein